MQTGSSQVLAATKSPSVMNSSDFAEHRSWRRWHLVWRSQIDGALAGCVCRGSVESL
jgi:hypothetical protein